MDKFFSGYITSAYGINISFERCIPSNLLPTKIVFSGKYTHVFFADGTKESVKMMDGENPDDEHAVASAIAHRVFGSKTKFRKFVANNGYRQESKED